MGHFLTRYPALNTILTRSTFVQKMMTLQYGPNVIRAITNNPHRAILKSLTLHGGATNMSSPRILTYVLVIFTSAPCIYLWQMVWEYDLVAINMKCTTSDGIYHSSNHVTISVTTASW